LNEIHIYDKAMNYKNDYGIKDNKCKPFVCFRADGMMTYYDLGTVEFKLPNGQVDGKQGYKTVSYAYVFHNSQLDIGGNKRKFNITGDTLTLLDGSLSKNGILTYMKYIYRRYNGPLPEHDSFCK
jgi:hypothetical protein